MTTTVRNLMSIYSRPPIDIDNDRTTSRKPWTETYPSFHADYMRLCGPKIQQIMRTFGPGSSTSDADSVGLRTAAYPLNVFPQLVRSEGDVTRDFDQDIIAPVTLAFSGKHSRSIARSDPQHVIPIAPALWSRSLVGGSTTSKVVDFQATMSHSQSSLEAAAVIGEMKKPRSIQRGEWLLSDPVSGVTGRLQSELRAYAHVNRCPQVFLFDSMSLVLIQFRAMSVDDIQRADCPIDVCVVPREHNPNITDQCTMQYALYWFFWRGWVRLCATLDHGDILSHDRAGNVIRTLERRPMALSIGQLTRSYIFWSGEPTWHDVHGMSHDISSYGYRRDFTYSQRNHRNGVVEIKGYWVWMRDDEEIKDTRDCFISAYSALF